MSVLHILLFFWCKNQHLFSFKNVVKNAYFHDDFCKFKGLRYQKVCVDLRIMLLI